MPLHKCNEDGINKCFKLPYDHISKYIYIYAIYILLLVTWSGEPHPPSYPFVPHTNPNPFVLCLKDETFDLGLKFELTVEVRPRVASAVLMHVHSSEGFVIMYIHHGAVSLPHSYIVGKKTKQFLAVLAKANSINNVSIPGRVSRKGGNQ